MPGFPADLPWLVEYRMASGSVLVALPRKPVAYVSSSGSTNASVITPQIPIGCTGWRASGLEWRELKTIPPAWLPFLDRERPGPMDPRPKLEGGKKRVLFAKGEPCASAS